MIYNDKKISSGLKKMIFLGFFVIFIFLGIKDVFASGIQIFNIDISDMRNGGAILKWDTNVNTRADIYYGETPDNLDRFMGYSLYDLNHESYLSGLEIDEKYYFKIVAIDVFGNGTESFVQSFDTKGMVDTTPPEITSYRVVQTIWDSVMITWTTNKKTKADIRYGTDENNLKSKASSNTYSTEHVKIISKLSPNSRYFLQLVVKDKNSNTDNRSFVFNTASKPSSEYQNIFISRVEPLVYDSPLISARSVIIKFRTNWASKATIYYGTKQTSLNKSIKNNNLNTDHEIVLSGLEPGTQYFFKIKVHDTFHSKTKITNVFSLKTKKIETNLKTGDIVKGSSNHVYVIQGNNKAWIENEKVFTGLGYKWNMIKETDDNILENYKDATKISNIRRHPEGTLIKYKDNSAVYLIENKKKRPFYTQQAFERAGYNWGDIIEIDTKAWSYSTGEYIC